MANITTNTTMTGDFWWPQYTNINWVPTIVGTYGDEQRLLAIEAALKRIEEWIAGQPQTVSPELVNRLVQAVIDRDRKLAHDEREVADINSTIEATEPSACRLRGVAKRNRPAEHWPCDWDL